MKELSIEEKARAYDKALEKAKSKIKNDKDHVFYEDDIIELFPQLKESEDERIRKELITHCRNTRCVTEEGAERIAKWISWLEKQGKKPQGKSALEAIKEEKVDNANKVEPKFRNGQWIVWQDKCYKVNYNGCGYELVDQDGLSTSLEYGTIDENAHIWDITKDAKDGDILCTYECDEPKIVFILKGTSKKHYALSYHCYYNIMYPHFESDSKKGCLAPNDEDVKPATKEQREQLEKAMADAGYTFDFDKKELKKIEQNPAEDSCKNSDDIITEEKDRTEYKKGFECGKQRVLKYPEDFDLCKKTLTAWSEEDEYNFAFIQEALLGLDGDDSYREKCCKMAEWLESLKPQNTWKPSDEQMERLKGIINSLPHQEVLYSLYQDLLKLKE